MIWDRVVDEGVVKEAVVVVGKDNVAAVALILAKKLYLNVRFIYDQFIFTKI